MRCAGRRREVRLSLRPGRAAPGRGGPAPGAPGPGSHGTSYPRLPPTGEGITRGPEPAHGEGRAGWDPPGKFPGRHVPRGVTVQGGETGLRACRGSRRHTAPTRVSAGISQRWEVPNHFPPPLPGAGGPLGDLPTPPPSCFKEGQIILRERSAGARRWLRADGSGTSKVISSSNIAFLTHMVKSAWRQLGEVPVVTSV